MQIISSKPVSLTEVAELLNERKKEASGTLEYEQANTLAYAEAFAQLTESKIASLEKEITAVTALPDAQMISIADLLPKSEEELAHVLSAGKVELPKEQLKEIIKIVKKYKKA